MANFNVTVGGRRYIVGLAGDQWYVLDLDEGVKEKCHNYATARRLANDWNKSDCEDVVVE